MAFADELRRFLLPYLHLSSLGNQVSVRGLRRALDGLPKELDKTYCNSAVGLGICIRECIGACQAGRISRSVPGK